MLTGKELGRAIESAREKSGISKAELARQFEVSPQSVQGWVKNGRVAKDKLIGLITLFQPYVAPEHWGLTAKKYSALNVEQEVEAAGIGNETARASQLARNLAGKATPRSRRALEQIQRAAEDGRLTEKDIQLLQQIAERFWDGKKD